MTRRIASLRNEALERLRGSMQRARRRLVPDGMETTFADQHTEAVIVRGLQAGGATGQQILDAIDNRLSYLKRVIANGGNPTTFSTQWWNRREALADISEAERRFRILVHAASTPEEAAPLMAALGAFENSKDADVTAFLAAIAAIEGA